MLLYTGGHKSWSVVSALRELGMEVIGTSVRKSTDADKDRIKQLLGEDAHMFDSLPAKEMYATLSASGADVLVSGGRSQFVALKAKVPWVDINQERHEAYAAYEGMVALVAALDRAINNPMWTDLRGPAPWDAAWTTANATLPVEG